MEASFLIRGGFQIRLLLIVGVDVNASHAERGFDFARAGAFGTGACKTADQGFIVDKDGAHCNVCINGVITPPAGQVQFKIACADFGIDLFMNIKTVEFQVACTDFQIGCIGGNGGEYLNTGCTDGPIQFGFWKL